MAGFGGKSFIEVKGMFFDRVGVSRQMDKAKLRFLPRAGALVMTVARRSIKQSDKPSNPGEPPHGHGNQQLKRNIFFGLDRSADPECVVGPINLNSKGSRPVRGTIPGVLERSGQIWVQEVFQNGRWRRVSGRRNGNRFNGLPIRLRKVKVDARPFMGPSLAAVRHKLPSLMKGTFKRG